MTNSPARPSADLIARFAAIVGEKNALTAEADTASYLVEPRELYPGKTALVLRPGCTQEVSEILKLANAEGVAVVPQGGNTGLVGGQIPDVSGAQVIVSLSRMNRIREIDETGNTMTVEAGVVLETIHQEAEKIGRLFPLTLGAQGSCEIGGNLSTNAGGTAVLAYGNTRELILGVEVVLPDGRIWEGLRKLRKDNTGYDLKQLFIGAEGTLGIVTAAVLKLFPAPKAQEVAFAGLSDPEGALKLFNMARARAGSMLTGFELMPRLGIEFTLKHLDGARDPLMAPHPWYVLMELSSGSDAEAARALMELIFEDAFEHGLVDDAALAESFAHREAFWRLRHGMSDVQKMEGGSIKHDVSVPVARIPEFLERATRAVEEAIPGCRPCPFGHMGDGNIHYNISQPVDGDKEAFLARWDEANAIVHEIVAELGGSISAEHGIGIQKRHLLPKVKSDVELDMMRALKATFDPNGIMNPGKML